MSSTMADWTAGAEAIVLQSCSGCGRRWLFARSFCPGCGRPDPVALLASGDGVIVARSQVHRAATAAAKAHVPYLIVLVDLAEGVRMMAHGDGALAIGDRVTATYRPFAGRLVPYFISQTNFTNFGDSALN